MSRSNKDGHESSEEKGLDKVFEDCHDEFYPGYEDNQILFNLPFPYRKSNQSTDVRVKALALHKGDHKPIDVRRSRYREGDTELMELPLGFIDTTVPPFRYGRVLEKEGNVLAEDLKEPIHETWADDYKKEVAQKMNFLRLYMYMFYVVESGQISDTKVGNRLCDMLHIRNRVGWSTDYEGRRYGYQKTYKELRSGSSSHSNSSKAPSLLDLYGGDEQMASDAYNNIN